MAKEAAHKWLVLAAVGVGIFMGTLDSSIVNIALPTLMHAFHVEFAAVQWIALAYMLVLTTLIPSVGRLGDMLGKKPLFAAGFVIFTLGSLACGLSSSLAFLIAARAFQGVGAAITSALGPAIVTEVFPRSERGRALGTIGSVVAIGIVAGPTLGGLLLSAVSWHWIFLINVPVGMVGVAMVWRFVPHHGRAAGQRFDLVGAVLLFVALASFLLALTAGQHWGFVHPWTLGLFALASAGMALFVRLEKRHSAPMLDLGLFSDRRFSAQLLSAFLLFVALSGVVLLLPFYLQSVLHYNTRQAGMLMAVTPLLMAFVAPLSGVLSDKFGSGRITRLGLVVVFVGYTLLLSLSTETTYLGYLGRVLVVGLGMGLFQAPNNSAILGSVAVEHLGTASGLMAVSRTLGQVTGQGVLGALWAWRSKAYAQGAGIPGAPLQLTESLQVYALHDTLATVLVIIAMALLMNVRAYRKLQ